MLLCSLAVVAIGIDALGYPEVLGIAVRDSEAEGFWRQFLSSLGDGRCAPPGSAVRCAAIEFTLEGGDGSWVVAEQLDRLHQPQPIDLGERGECLRRGALNPQRAAQRAAQPSREQGRETPSGPRPRRADPRCRLRHRRHHMCCAVGFRHSSARSGSASPAGTPSTSTAAAGRNPQG